MASQDLKHRTTTKPEEEEEREVIVQEKEDKSPIHQQQKDSDTDMDRGRRQKKKAMAKRGLYSLGLAVALPVSLTLLDIYFFGSNLRYATMKKSFLYPPLWALHLACLGSAFLMSLAGWLVWADGGFHRSPSALGLFLGQMALGLAWDPIVFRGGAIRVGLVMCVALFGALAGCIRVFRAVNPIAGDLVKPTLFCALLLTLVNLKLLYH